MHSSSPRPTFVLLVDADPDRAQALARELRAPVDPAHPFAVETTGDLRSSLERLAQGGIDVVLLDPTLPDSDGLGTCEQTRSFAPDVPVVVWTDLDDPSLAVDSMRAGAQDYLIRDQVDRPLLVRSIRYAIERNRLLTALRSLSLIDDLTGLYNRRGFMELGAQFLKLARRSGRGASLVSVNLDDFRRINDTHGHHVGDRALMQVGEGLRGAFRRSDLVARLSADSFAVLAPTASAEPVDLLVARVNATFAALNHDIDATYSLSASIGIAATDATDQTSLSSLLEAAEGGLRATRAAGSEVEVP